MDEEEQVEGKVICIWGGRKELKVNGGEVHGCPLRPYDEDGAIDLEDCEKCASYGGKV